MASRFSVSAIFKGVNNISKPVSKMGNSIAKFTRNAQRKIKRLGRAFKSLGKIASKATKTIAVVGVGALGFALVGAAKDAIAFEQTIVNAAAKFGPAIQKGTEEFDLLAEAARRTGKETEFTAVQSAQALNFLAQAGFSARQSIAALPGVVDLATAANVDLATATDIATDTLGALGLATKDPIQLSANLARVNDVLAKTTTTANTNMEQMFEAITKAGPVATSAGASIETLSSLIGILANSGIKGSDAGTALKNVFIKLSAQTPIASKTLKKLGVQTKDAAGNLRDMPAILGDLDKSLAGLGTADRAEVLNNIFGKIPIAAVNVLLEAGAENINDYRNELLDAEGAAAKMAATMRDTLQGRINSLTSAFEGLGITIFGLEGGAFTKLIERATEMLRIFDAAILNNQEFGEGIVSDIIDTVTGAIGIIGLLVGSFIAVKTVIIATQVAMILFKTTILLFQGALFILKGVIIALKVAQFAWNVAMLLNPIGAIVALVIGLIAVGALLIANWDKVSAFFVGLWDDIGNAFSTGIDFVMGILKPFQLAFSGISGLFEKFGIVFEKGDSEEKAAKTAAETPQIISPAERVSRSIEESISESKSTLTIKDESGRAELQEGKPNGGVRLQLASSGAF